MGRLIGVVLIMGLLAAACGESEEPTTTEAAAAPADELQALALADPPEGAELMFEAPLGFEALPPDSELTEFLNDTEAVAAHAALYQGPDGWILNGAIRFPDQATAKDAEEQFRDRAGDIVAAAFGLFGDPEDSAVLAAIGSGGVVQALLAQTGDTGIVAQCSNFDRLAAAVGVVSFSADLGGCDPRNIVNEVPLDCPPALDTGNAALAFVVTPIFAQPLVWEADPDTIVWTVDGPAEAAPEGTARTVSANITAGSAETADATASVMVEYMSRANVTAFNLGFVPGPAIKAACEIAIVDETAPVDASGVWEFAIDTTPVSNWCGPQSYTTTLTIEQDGGDVTVTGVSGQRGEWEGTVVVNTLTFGGIKDDPPGETEVTFVLTVEGDTMTGTELWSYEDSGGTCIDEESTVTVTRTG